MGVWREREREEQREKMSIERFFHEKDVAGGREIKKIFIDSE